jgi:ABC-type polysaccharide/polyol phosphate export permease
MSDWKIFKSSGDFVKYKDLLYMLTWRDIMVKYKQSVMGFMWAIFMPMIIILAGILVRYAFSKISGEPVAIKDLAGVSVKAVPWSFFVGSIRFATMSLISNANLVTKIYFPRELFPISTILSQFFDFVVASVVVAIMLVIEGVGVSVQLLWVPVLLTILFVLVISLGILLSALALFLRDVKYLVEVILTMGIFFTPVFYEVRMFGKWASILLLNPVAPLLEGLNACIVDHEMPAIGWIAYSGVFAVSALFLSILTFKSLEPYFAESI